MISLNLNTKYIKYLIFTFSILIIKTITFGYNSESP